MGVNTDFWKVLGRRVKQCGLGIPDSRPSVERVYNTSKASSGELVGYILGGTTLNYIVDRACVRGESVGARKEQQHVEMVDLDR